MKIKRIAVTALDEGVHAFVELFAADLSVAEAVAAIQARFGDPEPASRDPVPAAEEIAPKPRRRHQNPLAEATAAADLNPTEGSAASDTATTAASPAAASTATSDDGPTPARRRRRSEGQSAENPTQGPAAEAAPSAPETSAPATPTETLPRRRRRSESASDAATTQPASSASTSDAPAQEGRRRRRSVESVESAPANTSSASEDKITDADLSKAASEGARALTPKVVMEFLATFGLKAVQELKGGQRRAFIDGLKAKKEAA